MPNIKSDTLQRAITQLGDRHFQVAHDVENVDAFFHLRVKGDRFFPIGQQRTGFIPQFDLNRRDVAQPNRIAATPVQHHVTKLVDIVFPGISQRILAAANVIVATRRVLVAAGQSGHHRNIDVQCCRSIRVERDADFLFSSAVRIRLRYAWHALNA